MTSPTHILERDAMAVYDEWTVADLLSILRRRRRIVLGMVFALLLLVTLYCLLITPLYQATGEIEIQREPSGAFGLDNGVLGDTSHEASDALENSMSIETQAGILESDTLALHVIRALDLESTQNFFPAKKRGLTIPGWIFFWRSPLEPRSVPLEEAPNRRYVALRIFARHLTVQPVTGTRLIEIRYSDPDPALAARVVNRLVQALADYTFQSRLAQTSESSSWLAGQMSGLKKQAEALQTKAIGLQSEAGMYGDNGSHDVVLAQLENLNQALSQAELNRILKEAIDHTAQSGDPELISGLTASAGAEETGGLQHSLELIETLRSRESTAKAELAQDETRYGAAWPGMQERQAQLTEIQKSIHDEVRRVGERAHADYEIAQRAEDTAREEFEKQKTLAAQMNDRRIAWTLARQEADESRRLYDQLFGKLKQAGVLEGLHTSSFSIVNPARIPPGNHPKSPNLPLYYAAALGAGLFLGCAGAITCEFTDRSITSLTEVERLTGAPLFSVIPLLEPSFHLPRLLRGGGSSGVTAAASWELQGTGSASGSPFSESLRTLRASLMLSRSSAPPQVLLVTGTRDAEGKSTIALNLAAILAHQGAQVLLVDGDLRRPALHRYLNMPESPGLSEALAGSAAPPEPQPLTALPSLALLHAGRKPPFPSELIASRRMEELLGGWRHQYDFIVLDSPPVLPFADALVLSQMSDATLLVARPGVTAKPAIARSYRALSLQMAQNAVLGVVLNGVRETSAEYYEYYGYKGSRYGGTRT
ncbi:GumC family protein [Paracidobacterium acidisoli]|uniref:Polysaccharide biosynthesis tyrosine autokinase n=1 Tax=Paracidobacterium acidisoli TaxID=2303751 RepID=A0A372IT17_9BACT|nr:polysaccharide biosynthesis tyrosine autokinase [Paracidobacterium acidisoli]MBT9329479.1 polysaccharide biosynthesis tyrosine autokinase [Paracidobacterium acidisoli]